MEKKLVELGGNEWKKGYYVIYFNSQSLREFYGLELDHYKTGSISHATLDGERISNSQARRELRKLSGQVKFWYDIPTQSFQAKGMDQAVFDKIVARIKEALNA